MIDGSNGWEAVADLDEGETAFRSGVLLSLTNPQNIGYWAALGTALGTLGVRDPGIGDYSVFFAGFMLSSVVWAFLFLALAMASLRDLWISRSPNVGHSQQTAPSFQGLPK